jgi:hypothetical protein
MSIETRQTEENDDDDDDKEKIVPVIWLIHQRQ